MINNKMKVLQKIGKEGFTLTEMMIVIAIIGVVMAIVASNVSSKFMRAKVDATKIQIKQIGTVLDDFRRDCGFYPTSEQGLDALLKKPAGRECKHYDPEGYIKGKSVPRDGFGYEFTYESDGNKYKITSLGSDNQPGGENYDKDITSDDAD